MEKQSTVSQQNDDRNKQEDSCLDHFAVRMGIKHFVGDVGGEVEEDGDEDAPAGFVIEPVHQEDEDKKAQSKIECIDSPFGDEVALVVALDGGQREVPYCPVEGEDHGSPEEAEASPEGIGAVGVPGQLFDDWGKEENQPGGEERRGKRRMSPDDKLIQFVSEQQGEELGDHEAQGDQEEGGEEVDTGKTAKAEERPHRSARSTGSRKYPAATSTGAISPASPRNPSRVRSAGVGADRWLRYPALSQSTHGIRRERM